MVRLPYVRAAVAAWIVTEVVLFALVAGAIGVPNTILLGAATSLVGFLLLRQGGSAALGRLRRATSVPSSGSMVDDVGKAAAGLSLILPGFLSDLIGAALLIAPFRRRLAARLLRAAGVTAPRGDGTIDLDPSEWQRGDAPQDRTGRLPRAS